MSRTISWPSSEACSSTSTRAQSMVSLTDGSFFKSSVRTSWMKPTICLRSVCEMLGTRLSTIRSSSFCSGKPICRCRQRRFRASPRSRSLFEVRITVGGETAETVPSSGIVTWKSLRISKSSDSNSASDLSISSISSTQPVGCSSACSSGRGSTNSLEKNTSPKSCSWSSAACSVSAPPKTSPSLSFRICV